MYLTHSINQSNHFNTRRIDIKHRWYPRLIVANKAEDVVSEPVDPLRHISIPKDGYVRMKMRIKGKMQEIYELADFPFDTQDLQINIRSIEDYHTIGRFVPGIPNRTNSYQNLPLVHWTQHEHIVDCDMTAADLSTSCVCVCPRRSLHS